MDVSAKERVWGVQRHRRHAGWGDFGTKSAFDADCTIQGGRDVCGSGHMSYGQAERVGSSTGARQAGSVAGVSSKHRQAQAGALGRQSPVGGGQQKGRVTAKAVGDG